MHCRHPPLRRAGLQYHDIVVDNDVHNLAVSRLPEEAQVARQRRLKRAIDLSLKHEEVPKDAQTSPWAEYNKVQAVLEETQMLEDEKAYLKNQLRCVLLSC